MTVGDVTVGHISSRFADSFVIVRSSTPELSSEKKRIGIRKMQNDESVCDPELLVDAGLLAQSCRATRHHKKGAEESAPRE